VRYHRISEEELVEMTRLADSLADRHKTYREVALIVAKRLQDERDALDAELSGLLDGLIGLSAHDGGMDDALRVAHANLTELIWCRDQLGELLATIHRDGGHHTARVGLAASARDAHDRVIREREANDNASQPPWRSSSQPSLAVHHMSVDATALRERLAEYDPNREKCDGFSEQRTNMAPDDVREGDPAYRDYDLVLRNPCCRPKGHEGPCRTARPILGWPGRDTLLALLDEVEHLRRVVALERADESAALPGWYWNPHARYWYSDDGWGIWRGQTSSWSVWLGRIKRDYADCPIDFRNSKSFPTVWDAMNAAPRSTP
jgi:hypothetical protein